MANKKFTSKLMNFFSIGKHGKEQIPEPIIKDNSKGSNSESPRIAKEYFPPEIKKLWDWYTSANYDNFDTLKARIDRIKDMDSMQYNDTIISLALEMYADEVVQVDDKFELFKISSQNSKVAKRIRELFDQWGLTQNFVRRIAFDIIKYGDCFILVDSDEEHGVKDLTYISPYDVVDRLEFKASEIEKKSKQFRNNYRGSSVTQYFKQFNDKNDKISLSYKEYLFGYVIGENHYLAPWQMLHFRLMINGSEFYPFGRPLFLNLIGPYRMYHTALNFMGMARPASFPKNLYKVKSSEEMTKAEKWDAVTDARTQFYNYGKVNKKKDEFALGEDIWLTDDIEHETINTDINLDDIGDIELLRDNLIAGTKLPKDLIITNESSWGTSAQAIFQQSKPVARTCYAIQSCILERVVWLVRLHFYMTGEFDGENTEFEIGMNFPVIEEASDRLNAKKDAMDFAVDIINNLKDVIGYNGDALPKKLIKKIFSKFTFLSPEEVNDYVDMVVKVRDKELGIDSTDDEESEKEIEKFSEDIKKFETRLTEDAINESYQQYLREHNIYEQNGNGRHTYANLKGKIKSEDHDMFNIIDIIKDKHKLNEELQDE